jgi:hypothetical protein
MSLLLFSHGYVRFTVRTARVRRSLCPVKMRRAVRAIRLCPVKMRLTAATHVAAGHRCIGNLPGIHMFSKIRETSHEKTESGDTRP